MNQFIVSGAISNDGKSFLFDPLKKDDPMSSLELDIYSDKIKEAIEELTGGNAILQGSIKIEYNKELQKYLSILSVYKIHNSSVPSPGINSICLVGRAGQDPELKYFEGGSSVAKFSLAVKGRHKDDVSWFNLEVWNRQAEIAADYVKKGSLIGVSGSFGLERWVDKATGSDRIKPIVRVQRLDLLGSKNQQQEPATDDGPL